jgi:hypothetical protein
MIAAGSRSHNQLNLFFPDNRVSKLKGRANSGSASKSEASLYAVIFTVAAYPNEGERDSGKDARSSEKPI